MIQINRKIVGCKIVNWPAGFPGFGASLSKSRNPRLRGPSRLQLQPPCKPCGPTVAEMRLPGVSRGLRPGRKPLVSIPRSHRRAYNLAVVGGGITGLTSVWQASHDPQCTGITLYEKEARLGGWLQSERIPVDGGHVLFEYGPRTLRSSFPGSLPLINMVISLQLNTPRH